MIIVYNNVKWVIKKIIHKQLFFSDQHGYPGNDNSYVFGSYDSRKANRYTEIQVSSFENYSHELKQGILSECLLLSWRTWNSIS